MTDAEGTGVRLRLVGEADTSDAADSRVTLPAPPDPDATDDECSLPLDTSPAFASRMSRSESSQRSARSLAASAGTLATRSSQENADAEELARFGSLDRVPRLAISIDELRRRDLDAETGFLISLIDGVTAFESILDVCAMPRRKALALFQVLRFLGVLDFERGDRT